MAAAPATEGAMLLGQDEQRDQFESALAAGRMPHAWLLEGPRGLGKRGFADWAALRLLGGSTPEGREAAAHLVRAGSHPDFRTLQSPTEGKGSATGVIPVEQVRELPGFLRSHAALSPWRVVIVDAAEDLNRSSANGLLKLLEEPGGQTVFLLVSHAPARLLPTVRSRCRRLRFRPLTDSALAPLVADLSPADQAALLKLARGSPGDLTRLRSGDALGLLRDLVHLPPARFARQFQGATALDRFRLLVDLAPRHLAQQARARRDARIAVIQQEATRLAAEALPGALDRQQTAHALAQMVQAAAGTEP
jgi:DNA polymerase-3 subunit delta'